MTAHHRTSHPQRVLVAGGGFAGLSVIGNLLDLCQGRKARFDLDKVAGDDANGQTVDVLITIVDERDGYFHYDFFVAATGLHRAWPVVPRSLTKSEFLSDVRDQVKAIQDAKDGVVVIGGGEFRGLSFSKV
ncbi:hypothetical protein N0V84_003323 [Fusarium piperis]|uniref:FAD/NAD(P)-binding domain-containing protein n=1 Tax=Fusarium piperis TaxID=1435070 RepID=A0A9W8WHN5_9HYPO|nr:hypothetical protein N0V84_003323 [Fusarium piperis]